MSAPVIDQEKLVAFSMRAIADIAAANTGVMVSLGFQLALYKAMADAGPLSAKQIAQRVGCAERYVLEWLKQQASAGYLLYHPASDTYALSSEQATVLADEDSPFFVPHAWNVTASMWFDEPKAIEAFRSGRGVARGEHHERIPAASPRSLAMAMSADRRRGADRGRHGHRRRGRGGHRHVAQHR